MTVAPRGFALVIAAPSGAGKTSLARALVERNLDTVAFSVSATTRRARERERDGVDYHFVSDGAFDAMLAAGELLEWAEVHGRRYGTPHAAVRRLIDEGRVVVLDIDVQGARQIRSRLDDAVLVFILPPSAEELHRRLGERRSESAAELARRLQTARSELGAAGEFDYVVVNDEFERACHALEAIVSAERHRGARMPLAEELRRLDTELNAIFSARSD